MNNDELLSAMEQVESFSALLHTTSWAWGGLTVDIHQGRILRNHRDLDYLTLHLHELIDPLTGMFQAAGWQARHLENGDLKLEKNETAIQLGHLEISGSMRWAHNGELGSLYFPTDWLIQQPKRFYDLDVHVVAPELQYFLLEHPDILNPVWKPRQKDLAAKAVLKTMLVTSKIDIEGLQTMIHG